VTCILCHVEKLKPHFLGTTNKFLTNPQVYSLPQMWRKEWYLNNIPSMYFIIVVGMLTHPYMYGIFDRPSSLHPHSVNHLVWNWTPVPPTCLRFINLLIKQKMLQANSKAICSKYHSYKLLPFRNATIVQYASFTVASWCKLLYEVKGESALRCHNFDKLEYFFKVLF
jgi:hypothetical protein